MAAARWTFGSGMIRDLRQPICRNALVDMLQHKVSKLSVPICEREQSVETLPIVP